MSDPIGKAISLYLKDHSKKLNIIVHSKEMEDDVIPVHYLFRTYRNFTDLEKIAVKNCRGRVLDVGAGTGVHSKYLMKNGFEVKAIDTSNGAVSYMNSLGINSECVDFMHFNNEKFDTLILLMNGIGLAGKCENLTLFLTHAMSLLDERGQILVDSTDVKYLYQEEDGSVSIYLNSEYYGNFTFQMECGEEKSEWFDWTYVDLNLLTAVAESIGFQVERLYQNEYNFLLKLYL